MIAARRVQRSLAGGFIAEEAAGLSKCVITASKC
jgi:hypothetical protein